MELNNEFGKITVNNNVIKAITSNVLKECYGVCGLANISAKDGLYEILGFENASKGVDIQVKDGFICIDVYVVVQYGIKISVVGENIIETVKYNVENLTGLKVKKVNVVIQAIKIQQ